MERGFKMIKSNFRLFVLVFFVLGFSINTNAEESEALYSAVSNIESYQASISDIIPYLWQQLEDIIVQIGDHSYQGFAFNIYSDQLEWALDGTRPFYTQDQQLYDEFYNFHEAFDNYIQGTSTILDHLYDLPELNASIDNNISSTMALLDTFSNQFTFDNGDLNVYDQRLAGLIQELKDQSGEHHDADTEQIKQLGESIANGFNELGETIRDSSSTSPADNYLTQTQLEESYEKFLIPNFYQSFRESKAIPFADYISWSDPTSLDYKEDSSFDIKVQSPLENSDGDFFQVLSGYLSNLASLHANNSRSLVLMTKIMKGDNHKAEEDEIKNDINENLGRDQEIQQAMDELITKLEDSYTTQKSAKFFDLSSLENIASVSLPNEINLGSLPLSNIFGIDLTEFKNFYLDISFFHPMIEVSRSVFSIILYLFLGSIAIFIYRLSAPFIFRIIDLLKSAFANW